LGHGAVVERIIAYFLEDFDFLNVDEDEKEKWEN